MRVLIVTNMYPTPRDPAYGVFVQSHVSALAAEGVHVDVVFIDGRSRSSAYLTGIMQLRRLVRRTRFDVIHAHYGLTGFVAAFQPRPLVVTFWGDDLLGTPSRAGGITFKSRVGRWISSFAALRAHALICVSENLRSALRRKHDRLRAHVIPGGIDITQFCPGDRLEARRRLGLSPHGKIVLFPNTPTERRKRLDLAETAVKELGDRYADLQLRVVTGVANEEMPDYYRAADCLLLTSDWEGSPTVVKEALCCDLPVVSVDAGDAWRWLGLAPGCQQVSRDVAAIAAGLRKILDNPRNVNGAQVRAQVGWRRIVQEILAVYHGVITTS